MLALGLGLLVLHELTNHKYITTELGQIQCWLIYTAARMILTCFAAESVRWWVVSVANAYLIVEKCATVETLERTRQVLLS